MAFRRARRQACGLAFVMGRRRRTGGPPWFGSPGPSRHDRLAPWEKPRFEFHGRHEGSVKDSWSFGVRFAGWKPSRFDLRDSFDASGAQLLSWHCSWCNVLVPLDAACSACGCVRPSADPARPRAQPQHQSSPARSCGPPCRFTGAHGCGSARGPLDRAQPLRQLAALLTG